MHRWEMVSHLPCEYGLCPEGCREEWRKTDDCPHEYWEEGITHSITAMGCTNRREAVEDAKNQLRLQQRRRTTGWPVEEATRFLDEPWIHKREPFNAEGAYTLKVSLEKGTIMVYIGEAGSGETQTDL